MNIQWNTVTWYSKLAAVIVFVVTFFLAFNLGIVWEQTHIETSIIQIPISSGSVNTHGVSGMACGGFMRNAPTCPTGYHCQLGTVADKGGVCVVDAAATTTP